MAPETAAQVRAKPSKKQQEAHAEGKALAKANYSEAEKYAAMELAAQIGIAPACRELGIGKTSFYRWVEQYPEKWSDLQKVRSTRLDELVDRYAAAEDAALDRATELLEGNGEPLDAKEVAALIKAMGSSRHGATIGARSVRGDPDQTATLQVNFPALEKAAEALLERADQRAIEGTAEEVD